VALRDIVPPRLRRLRHHPALLRGRRRECPCCGGRFRRLAPQGRRRNARCPGCGSLERHRSLCLYLRDRLGALDGRLAVLHFAPEPSVSAVLAALPQVDHTTADLDPGAADEQVDITDIPHADARFDLVLVSHVLEHVPQDAAALSELHRVLRPGGRVLLQHPIDYGRPQTYEDFSLRSAAERLAAFGQDDHVRVYGRDFRERVERAGFAVEIVRPGLALDPGLRSRYGILDPEASFRADDIYVCTKA
jgi:SAM-dependent methyltransferase